MLDIIRPGGMNSAIHAMACRHAVLPSEAIIGQIRDRIGSGGPARAPHCLTGGVINATAVTGAHCALARRPGPAGVAGDELATLRSAASVPGRGRAAGSAP